MSHASNVLTRLIISVALLTLGLIIFIFGTGPAQGEEVVKIACSAQAYEILQGGPLEQLEEAIGQKIELEVTTSAEAMNRLLFGLSDAAISAERMDFRLSAAGFKEYPFCKDALIVVAHHDLKIKNMTRDQVRLAFSKQITNAADLGGRINPLVIISPSETSALYRNFSSMFMGGAKVAYDIMTTQSTYVESFARKVDGALTFINQSATDPRLGRPAGATMVAIDGLTPADEGYPYYEIFSLILRGEPSESMTKLVEAFYSERFCGSLTSRCLAPVDK